MTLLLEPGAPLAFDRCVLDRTRRALMRDSEEVVIGERYLPILTVFTCRSGEVIPLDALIDRVWDGVVLSTHSLDHALARLRRTLSFRPVNPRATAWP